MFPWLSIHIHPHGETEGLAQIKLLQAMRFAGFFGLGEGKASNTSPRESR